MAQLDEWDGLFIINTLIDTARIDETAFANITSATDGIAWMARRHL